MQLIKKIGLFLFILFFSNAYATKLEDFKCHKCNVIFLNIDLLRNDEVGIINNNSNLTASINNFFNNSIVFTNASSSSGVTAISNTATLTGKDGFFIYSLLKNTYVDNPPQMPQSSLKLWQSIPTIFEILKAEGYRTFNVNHGWYAGKQMLLDRGVDYYWGTGEVDSPGSLPIVSIEKTASLISNIDQSTSPFFLLLRSEDLRGFPYRFPINREKLLDSRVTYRSMDEKFFEIRYQINEEGTLREGYYSSETAKWMSKDLLKEYSILSKKLYKQQVSYVDENLKKIFDSFDNNLLNNSIIVLYSNHGDGLYDNGIPNHGVSYESCVSVPLLIRHPKIKSPLLVNKSIQLIDLVPSILNMLDVKSYSEMDGTSLLKLLVDENQNSKTIFGIDKDSSYVKEGNFKLIIWSDRTKELYDLSIDPKEENNIINTRLDVAAKLENYLFVHQFEEHAKAQMKLTKFQNIAK